MFAGKAIEHDVSSWADPFGLIGSIAEVESKFGLYNLPKHERAFDLGGKYENLSRWKRWGAWAACSYSSFQIMYPVACEVGYDEDPWDRPPSDLWDDHVAIHWVLTYIRERILEQGVSTIKDFADAYNSGTHKDRLIPEDYIFKFTKAYQTVVEKYGLKL